MGEARSISRGRWLNGINALMIDSIIVGILVRNLLFRVAKARLRIPDVDSQSRNLNVAVTPQKESTETSFFSSQCHHMHM